MKIWKLESLRVPSSLPSSSSQGLDVTCDKKYSSTVTNLISDLRLAQSTVVCRGSHFQRHFPMIDGFFEV